MVKRIKWVKNNLIKKENCFKVIFKGRVVEGYKKWFK